MCENQVEFWFRVKNFIQSAPHSEIFAIYRKFIQENFDVCGVEIFDCDNEKCIETLGSVFFRHPVSQYQKYKLSSPRKLLDTKLEGKTEDWYNNKIG